MTTVRLNDTTLTILRHSASQIGLLHACSIDLVTGDWQCSDTCHARTKPHKHSAELTDLRTALAAFQAITLMSRYEAALSLSRTLKVQSGMSEEFLQFQCGQHPDQIKDGGAPWAAADTLAHQAARLVLADRAAIQQASRTTRKPAAA